MSAMMAAMISALQLYFLEKPDPFGLAHVMSFLSPVAGFGMLAAAFAFWRVGVAHYQSTGT